ncbi:WYL domain-containing protein [Pseudomonas sp. 21TX0197]|uniref:WYL domain-containing protein n=1 Tax=Pseudomonas sp. 21TX0197 TaxID=2972639 RepID=UPI00232C64B1|nr:WYL domain-containing protein [Pseudomonas sp. 21TX0197]MDB6443198.1 WYL domain-containing protein [Pseudomonas sp. 21TX0197]
MNHSVVIPSRGLDDLSHAQRERLGFIEHLLLLKGEASRAELMTRFGIAAAQATKDLAHYHSLAPANIEYDKRLRLHVRGKGFSALFDYDPQLVLTALSQCYSKGLPGKAEREWPCETPHILNAPSLQVITVLCEAIYKHLPVRMTYVSLSSGEQERVLVPHSLVDTGLRWHARGFDRRHLQFRDFVLTRILRVELDDSLVGFDEQVSQDKQWNRIVDLELRPHPSIRYKQAIELDYQMQGGLLRKECRAAVVGYLLRRWNVDCSPNHSLPGPEYQLCLANPLSLYGVENLAIAPGYQLPGNHSIQQDAH